MKNSKLKEVKSLLCLIPLITPFIQQGALLLLVFFFCLLEEDTVAICNDVSTEAEQNFSGNIQK